MIGLDHTWHGCRCKHIFRLTHTNTHTHQRVLICDKTGVFARQGMRSGCVCRFWAPLIIPVNMWCSLISPDTHLIVACRHQHCRDWGPSTSPFLPHTQVKPFVKAVFPVLITAGRLGVRLPMADLQMELRAHKRVAAASLPVINQSAVKCDREHGGEHFLCQQS